MFILKQLYFSFKKSNHAAPWEKVILPVLNWLRSQGPPWPPIPLLWWWEHLPQQGQHLEISSLLWLWSWIWFGSGSRQSFARQSLALRLLPSGLWMLCVCVSLCVPIGRLSDQMSKGLKPRAGESLISCLPNHTRSCHFSQVKCRTDYNSKEVEFLYMYCLTYIIQVISS